MCEKEYERQRKSIKKKYEKSIKKKYEKLVKKLEKCKDKNEVFKKGNKKIEFINSSVYKPLDKYNDEWIDNYARKNVYMKGGELGKKGSEIAKMVTEGSYGEALRIMMKKGEKIIKKIEGISIRDCIEDMCNIVGNLRGKEGKEYLYVYIEYIRICQPSVCEIEKLSKWFPVINWGEDGEAWNDITRTVLLMCCGMFCSLAKINLNRSKIYYGQTTSVKLLDCKKDTGKKDSITICEKYQENWYRKAMGDLNNKRIISINLEKFCKIDRERYCIFTILHEFSHAYGGSMDFWEALMDDKNIGKNWDGAEKGECKKMNVAVELNWNKVFLTDGNDYEKIFDKRSEGWDHELYRVKAWDELCGGRLALNNADNIAGYLMDCE